jgi:hypothetical protein
MCDKCIELDGKIEHYARVAASIPDQLTIDRIKELVEQTKAQKAALHPQQGEAISVGGLLSLSTLLALFRTSRDVRLESGMRTKA